MAGRTWMIIDADPEQSELLVTPVSDQASAPQWVGELPPVPKAIARDIGRLRHLIAEDIGAYQAPIEHDDSVLDVNALFADRDSTLKEHPIDDEAMGILAETITNHLELTGVLATDRKITIEEREDAIVINSCHGSRINEAIGHFLMAMASTKTGKWGRLVNEPTRISLQTGDIYAQHIIGWLTETPPDALQGLLSVTLPNSRQVRWRFAQVAKTFGTLPNGVAP